MKDYHSQRFFSGDWLKAFKVNKVIRHFVLSDLVLFSGWGLINPIFSVFVIQNIPGATLVTVGIVSSIYWLIRALIQLPIAAFLDRTDGEKDDFYVLLSGLVLASIAAFSFTLVRSVPQLYLVQILHAIAFGLYAPAWSGIYNRHLDKGKISFDLSLDSTVLALASGITGFLGGIVAQAFGFQFIFVAASIMASVAAVIIFLAPDLVFPRAKHARPTSPLNHTPRTTP
ncbi:MAG: MFS transporter [Candidatus Colwellbacteria bacterium]|nr:MFS transporter [Candidatus Colwellbacteria bacterium]